MNYLVALALIGVAASACVPGEKRNQGAFVKECLQHPMIGSYERTVGCHGVNIDGVDQTVAFGESVQMGQKLYGFYKTCTNDKSTGTTRFIMDSCYVYDLKSNGYVKVTPGNTVDAEVFEQGSAMKFSCKNNEQGYLSFGFN